MSETDYELTNERRGEDRRSATVGYAESRRGRGTVKLPGGEVNNGKDDNGKGDNPFRGTHLPFGEERNDAIMLRRACVRMQHFVELG